MHTPWTRRLGSTVAIILMGMIVAANRAAAAQPMGERSGTLTYRAPHPATTGAFEIGLVWPLAAAAVIGVFVVVAVVESSPYRRHHTAPA